MQLNNLRADAQAVREHGLDLVRAAAIASVMLYHANNMMLVPSPAPWLISFGWMGVDLFFVLSGFLIAGQLLKPWALGSRPDYSRFFARRALRTIPAFVAVLTLYFAFPRLRETASIQPLWQFVTFTENLSQPTGPKAFDQFWSLCVEEQFYLFFPLALILIGGKPPARRTVTILISLIAGGIILRSLLWLTFVADPPFNLSAQSNWQPFVGLIYYPTWSRLDGLLAGVALAILKIFRPSLWEKFVSEPNLLLGAGLIGIAGAIMLFGGPSSPLAGVALGFPLLSASVALIVASASTGKSIIGKYRVPGGQALATGAYSLYLSHKLAYHATQAWIGPALGVSGFERLILAICAALVVGGLLYWAVERPFLSLRDRLEGRSRSSLELELSQRNGEQFEPAI